MKTSELIGSALDWAVAKAEGLKTDIPAWATTPWVRCTDPSGMQYVCPRFHADWAQGGPIIERERLGVCYYHEADGWEVPNWAAWRTDTDDRVQIMGETALIAAMRCFCSAKLGDEIDIPEELCQQQNS